MLPFVLYPLHELLQPLLAADVGEKGVTFSEKRVIEKAAVDGVLKGADFSLEESLLGK